MSSIFDKYMATQIKPSALFAKFLKMKPAFSYKGIPRYVFGSAEEANKVVELIRKIMPPGSGIDKCKVSIVRESEWYGKFAFGLTDVQKDNLDKCICFLKEFREKDSACSYGGISRYVFGSAEEANKVVELIKKIMPPGNGIEKCKVSVVRKPGRYGQFSFGLTNGQKNILGDIITQLVGPKYPSFYSGYGGAEHSGMCQNSAVLGGNELLDPSVCGCGK